MQRVRTTLRTCAREMCRGLQTPSAPSAPSALQGLASYPQAMQLALDGVPVPVNGHRRRTPYDRAWQQVRDVVLRRDQQVCHWCGGHANTVDHLDPLADGGRRLDPDNLVAACGPCNSRRSAERTNRLRSLGDLSRDW